MGIHRIKGSTARCWHCSLGFATALCTMVAMFWIAWCYFGLTVVQVSESQRRAIVDYSYTTPKPSSPTKTTILSIGKDGTSIETSQNTISRTVTASTSLRSSSRGELTPKSQMKKEEPSLAKGDFSSRERTRSNTSRPVDSTNTTLEEKAKPLPTSEKQAPNSNNDEPHVRSPPTVEDQPQQGASTFQTSGGHSPRIQPSALDDGSNKNYGSSSKDVVEATPTFSRKEGEAHSSRQPKDDIQGQTDRDRTRNNDERGLRQRNNDERKDLPQTHDDRYYVRRYDNTDDKYLPRRYEDEGVTRRRDEDVTRRRDEDVIRRRDEGVISRRDEGDDRGTRRRYEDDDTVIRRSYEHDDRSTNRRYDENDRGVRKSYEDEDRAPVRKYEDDDRAPARKYEDDDRAPVRKYEDDDRAPVRKYADDDRAPARKYEDDDRAPVRKYADDDRPPARKYEDDDRAPGRRYKDDDRGPGSKYTNVEEVPRRYEDGSSSRRYGDDDRTPIRVYEGDGRVPDRKYVDDDRVPARRYTDNDRIPARRYEDEDRIPARRYEDEDRIPARRYEDEDRIPTRRYVDDDRIPTRRYVDDDRIPRYEDEDRGSARRYAEDRVPIRRYQNDDRSPSRKYDDDDQLPARRYEDDDRDTRKRYDDKYSKGDFKDLPPLTDKTEISRYPEDPRRRGEDDRQRERSYSDSYRGREGYKDGIRDQNGKSDPSTLRPRDRDPVSKDTDESSSLSRKPVIDGSIATRGREPESTSKETFPRSDSNTRMREPENQGHRDLRRPNLGDMGSRDRIPYINSKADTDYPTSDDRKFIREDRYPYRPIREKSIESRYSSRVYDEYRPSRYDETDRIVPTKVRSRLNLPSEHRSTVGDHEYIRSGSDERDRIFPTKVKDEIYTSRPSIRESRLDDPLREERTSKVEATRFYDSNERRGNPKGTSPTFVESSRGMEDSLTSSSRDKKMDSKYIDRDKVVLDHRSYATEDDEYRQSNSRTRPSYDDYDKDAYRSPGRVNDDESRTSRPRSDYDQDDAKYYDKEYRRDDRDGDRYDRGDIRKTYDTPRTRDLDIPQRGAIEKDRKPSVYSDDETNPHFQKADRRYSIDSSGQESRINRDISHRPLIAIEPRREEVNRDKYGQPQSDRHRTNVRGKADSEYGSVEERPLNAKDVIETALKQSDTSHQNPKRVSYPVFDPRMSNLTSPDIIRPSERRGTTIMSRKKRSFFHRRRLYRPRYYKVVYYKKKFHG